MVWFTCCPCMCGSGWSSFSCRGTCGATAAARESVGVIGTRGSAVETKPLVKERLSVLFPSNDTSSSCYI